MNPLLKKLRLIHVALCAGVLLAATFAFDHESSNILAIPELTEEVLFALIFPVVAVVAGQLFYQKTLKELDRNASEETRITTYQTASMIRWAMLEGVAFGFLFAFPDLSVISVLALVYMAFLFPSESRMTRDFKVFGRA